MCPANEPILHRSLKNRYMPTIMRGLKKKKKIVTWHLPIKCYKIKKMRELH